MSTLAMGVCCNVGVTLTSSLTIGSHYFFLKNKTNTLFTLWPEQVIEAKLLSSNAPRDIHLSYCCKERDKDMLMKNK